MKEIDIQDIINMNYRVLTLLGIATSMIMDYHKSKVYHDQGNKCYWWISAIQSVVYENKTLPPMP